MTSERKTLEDVEDYWNTLNVNGKTDLLLQLQIPNKFSNKEFQDIPQKYFDRLSVNILSYLRSDENYQQWTNKQHQKENKESKDREQQSFDFTKNIKNENYYDVIGVDRNASQEEIRKKRNELSIKLHPDKEPAVWATDLMKKINEAYETLSDSEKRRKYDSIL